MSIPHTQGMALWMGFDEVGLEPPQTRKKQRIGNDNLLSRSPDPFIPCVSFFLSLFLTLFISSWPCLYDLFILLLFTFTCVHAALAECH
jgi:hypothetical protein